MKRFSLCLLVLSLAAAGAASAARDPFSRCPEGMRTLPDGRCEVILDSTPEEAADAPAPGDAMAGEAPETENPCPPGMRPDTAAGRCVLIPPRPPAK